MGIEDDLTPEEEALLRNDNTPPIPAEEENTPVADPLATQPVTDPAAPAVDPSAAPTDGQTPSAPADPDADFKAYAERHAGKTPEDLMKLAYQQDRARSQARAEASEATKAIRTMRDGLTSRVEAMKAKQQQEREKFDETLRDDPDAAAKMAFDKAQARELAEAEALEHGRYIEYQTELAASVIPNFNNNAPEMLRFGIEALGFEEGDIRQIDDARELTALYMAMQYSNMMARGLVDMAGNIIGNGQPGVTAQPPVDPRLAAPAAPRTLSQAPGSTGGGPKGIREQVAEALAMADKDFEALPADQLEKMLREVSGAGR